MFSTWRPAYTILNGLVPNSKIKKITPRANTNQFLATRNEVNDVHFSIAVMTLIYINVV